MFDVPKYEAPNPNPPSAKQKADKPGDEINSIPQERDNIPNRLREDAVGFLSFGNSHK